jgi:hypothetical protein
VQVFLANDPDEIIQLRNFLASRFEPEEKSINEILLAEIYS